MPDQSIDAQSLFGVLYGKKPAFGCTEPGQEYFEHRRYMIGEICRSFAVPLALLKPQPVITLRAVASSLDEAGIIADCFRVMCPAQKVRVLETAYLTEYEVQAYNNAS
jgi:hypothetical protein